MRFGITKFEQLAMTSHLVGLPSPNPEYGRKRLRAWDEFGVADLADRLASSAVGVAAGPMAADWADTKTMHLVDVNADVLEHVLAGLSQQTVGVWSDAITRLRDRLEQLRDKKYKLPEELRTEKK